MDTGAVGERNGECGGMDRHRPSFTALVAFALILSPLVYLLSYPPVVKLLQRGPDLHGDVMAIADREYYPAYKPVDWLLDHTPLRGPLFYWAGVCGVREEFEAGSRVRRMRRAIQKRIEPSGPSEYLAAPRVLSAIREVTGCVTDE